VNTKTIRLLLRVAEVTLAALLETSLLHGRMKLYGQAVALREEVRAALDGPGPEMAPRLVKK
jgi:hypothetical protein